MDLNGGFTVTATRSGGTDGAVLIFIDGDFEPLGGVRVILNDCDIFASKRFEPSEDGNDREAGAISMDVTTAQIAYYRETPR